MNPHGKRPGFSEFEHYIRLLLRQKWFLVFPAFLGALGVGLYSLRLQNIYSAKATILVEPQSVSKRLISSAIPYGPERIVRTLVEQVRSRSRLEKVILEFNLYPEMRRKRPMEEVVVHMRRQIEIERRQEETFSISFSGPDPEKVQEVTNRLTDMFIEENLKYRLKRSEKNVALLEGQANRLRDEVLAQERIIQAFKVQNLDRLPEQRTSTQTQLVAAQQQLQVNGEALAAARAQLVGVRGRRAILARSQSDAGDNPDVGRDPLAEKLEVARQELLGLKSQYSRVHPDVRVKQREVWALEKQLANRPTSATAPSSPSRRGRSPAMLRARQDERMIRAEIARLGSERQRLDDQVEALNTRLELTPGVELKLSELTKGLGVLRSQADDFQKKATSLAASLEMERGNQGSQFRALDLARLPQQPISPNRSLLVLLGVGGGLLLGLAMVIGLDLMFRPFLDGQDLARYTGVPVLVSIPHVGGFPTETERVRGQVGLLLSYFVGALPFMRGYQRDTIRPEPSLGGGLPGRRDPREDRPPPDDHRSVPPAGGGGPGMSPRRIVQGGWRQSRVAVAHATSANGAALGNSRASSGPRSGPVLASHRQWSTEHELDAGLCEAGALAMRPRRAELRVVTTYEDAPTAVMNRVKAPIHKGSSVLISRGIGREGDLAQEFGAPRRYIASGRIPPSSDEAEEHRRKLIHTPPWEEEEA